MARCLTIKPNTSSPQHEHYYRIINPYSRGNTLSWLLSGLAVVVKRRPLRMTVSSFKLWTLMQQNPCLVKAVKKVVKQPFKDRKMNDKSPPLNDEPT
jgi:hypothetical protein